MGPGETEEDESAVPRPQGSGPGSWEVDVDLSTPYMILLAGNGHLQSSLSGSLNLDSYNSAVLCSKVLEIPIFPKSELQSCIKTSH